MDPRSLIEDRAPSYRKCRKLIFVRDGRCTLGHADARVAAKLGQFQ